jgi:4'-phosphopantetheinyl transferase
MEYVQTSWSSPHPGLVLGAREVHVWRVPLDQSTTVVQSLAKLLAADELKRASKFYFEKDRDRFVITRGVLRTLLGHYLQRAPAELCFAYSQYGKPALVDRSNSESVGFNVSHSHDLALVAFARTSELGLDLEYIRHDFDLEEVAEHFFSHREVATLRALPSSVRTQSFFNCWTRKEAYIKARGEGLSHPLDKFDVTLAPGESAALLCTAGDAQEAGRWSLRELAPGAGYAAAIAIEGHGWNVLGWQWIA